MDASIDYYDFLPKILPQKSIGKLRHKIIIKKDYKRNDGTNALYLQLFQNNRIKRIPLEIAVKVSNFDIKKQRVKSGCQFAEGYNLMIGKKLADLNTILVNYRLSGEVPTIEAVVHSLSNPGLRINFNRFASKVLEEQKESLRKSTYSQQAGALSKIKTFKDPILFSEIDADFIKELRNYCRTKLENKPATIESTIKNFKKYLHLANDKGIRTAIKYSEIKVKKMTGERVFLLPHELKKLYDYYQSPFIVGSKKMILQRYLFSCFTGIRISDSEQITADNFIGDHLAFTMYKTQKFIRIKLNQTALSLVKFPHIFEGSFTREHINRELKEIAITLGINKRVYFHSSRHTFATNFLISGGNVVNLRKLLGHSKIDETMIYVHIVESITDTQVDLLDNIIKDKI
tara:strand:- start:1160 stop:2365 length:1206 start_codon:yes stop_codon:yes gene_type:complete